MSTVSQIKDYYETYWSDGKATFSGANQAYADNFRRWMRAELANLAPGSEILEVGCGDATFTADLAKYSPKVTAIDISSRQIEENARRYPSIRFRQHDVAEPLPFADGSFQVVWCSEVLEHLFDPTFAVREMQRVLARHGSLLLTVPYHGPLKNILIALWNWDEHFSPSNPHVRFFSRRTLSEMVREAGFRSVRTGSCSGRRAARHLFIPTNLLLKAEKP